MEKFFMSLARSLFMPRISEFLEKYSSRNTKTVYRSAIFKFLDFVYNRHEENLGKRKRDIEEYEKLADRYFNEERDYGKDLIEFAAYLAKENVPPKTAEAYLAGVKEWFVLNDIELSQKIIKEIKHKKPKGGVKSEQEVLTKQKLKKILDFCDIRAKALFIVLANTGMRIGEALSIEIDDLRLNEEPPKIIVRQTKTGEMREVFLTQEAREMLIRWLEIRDRYLRESHEKTSNFRKKGKTPIDLQTKRVFPFSCVTAEKLWIEALEKAGLLRKDKITGRATMTIHSLRKFFRTQLVKAKLPTEVIDALMGHGRTSLRQIYTKFSYDEIVEMWRQAEDELTIYGEEVVNKMKEKLKKKEEELKRKEEELEKKMNEMKEKMMLELEMKIKQESLIHKATVEGLIKDKIELEQKIQRLEKAIEELRNFIVALVKGKVKAVPYAKTDEDVYELVKSEYIENVE